MSSFRRNLGVCRPQAKISSNIAAQQMREPIGDLRPMIAFGLECRAEGAPLSAGGTDETPPRISVIDVVTLVTGKDARKTARDFGFVRGRYPEVAQNLGLFKFPRKGSAKHARGNMPWTRATLYLATGASCGSCSSTSSGAPSSLPRRRSFPCQGKLHSEGESKVMLPCGRRMTLAVLSVRPWKPRLPQNTHHAFVRRLSAALFLR